MNIGITPKSPAISRAEVTVNWAETTIIDVPASIFSRIAVFFRLLSFLPFCALDFKIGALVLVSRYTLKANTAIKPRPMSGLVISRITNIKGIIEDSSSISATSSRPAGHSFKNPDVSIKSPTTIPMLKTFEPSKSPIDNAGELSRIEKMATNNSGVEVITESSAKPADVSPSPVIFMKSSSDRIT